MEGDGQLRDARLGVSIIEVLLPRFIQARGSPPRRVEDREEYFREPRAVVTTRRPGGRQICRDEQKRRLVRARVGPFECTTYRRFSAFLELHRSLKAALPASAKLPRSRPLRNERLQIQPHKHTEGRIRLLQKYVDELCAVPEASESAELAAFFWPEAGDGSVVAPDGSKGTLF